MKRLIVVVAVLAAALTVQLTIVNGLPLPGGGVPDLVLLCVVAIGLVAGPQPGLIAGFCAGLALDLAPPSTELVGQYALVFCLVGYASGRFSFALRSSAVAALAAATSAAVAGELLVGALVVALDTPEVTLATVARLLPSAVVYDVMLTPVVLVAAVRIAIALGVSLRSSDNSPAFEPGGSATPMGLARLATMASNGMGSASWLTGDPASVPAIGAVGWLNGPATTRRARREQARLTAALTGAEPRKGAVWVGSRPQGFRPIAGTGTPAPSTGLGKLKPDAGVAGSAARGNGAARPPDPPVPKIAFDTAHPRPRPSGGRVPKIAFDTAHPRPRPSGGRVPKIAFGADSGAENSQPASPGTPKIAFGSGGLPGAGRAGGRGVPRIRFGKGSLPGGGKAQAPKAPSITFGSGLPKAPRTSRGRPALPRFSAGSRSASGSWLATSRLRSAKFGGGAPAGGRLKAARWGRRRRYFRWLPFPRRSGGRSAVWRIGGRQIGGER